jgi:hypothetical protein
LRKPQCLSQVTQQHQLAAHKALASASARHGCHWRMQRHARQFGALGEIADRHAPMAAAMGSDIRAGRKNTSVITPFNSDGAPHLRRKRT